MSDQTPDIKDIINNTKNFDQPYAPPIPEGIHEVEVKSYVDGFSKNNHYRMLTLTVADTTDRTASVIHMLEIQFIEGTLRLVKGLYTHNAEDKAAAKDKINKFFDGAKDEADLQKKILEILDKLIEQGCIGWLRVEREHESDRYPDRALTAYEPLFRWKTAEMVAAEVAADGGEDVTDQLDADLFAK